MPSDAMLQLDTAICPVCEKDHQSPFPYLPCTECRVRYPASLVKACCDNSFDYALKLTDGTIIRFEGASVCGDWVHLNGPDRVSAADTIGDLEFHPKQNFFFSRGIDIHISQIVWCCDAPMGS